MGRRELMEPCLDIGRQAEVVRSRATLSRLGREVHPLGGTLGKERADAPREWAQLLPTRYPAQVKLERIGDGGQWTDMLAEAVVDERFLWERKHVSDEHDAAPSKVGYDAAG
ncbi:MAG: hypothetical protein R3B09_02250 [Nannocystaceae bacterium]